MTRYSLIAITLLSLSACSTSSDRRPDAGPGSGSGSGSGSNDTTPGITCSEIIDCASECVDDACVNSCIADGSTTAQEQILDLSECIQDSGCTDATCTAEKCGDLLDACYADSDPGDPTDPMGSPLPAAIVGTWGNSSYASLTTYQLTADGHVTYTAALHTGTGSCDSKYVRHYEGVVQLASDVLSIAVTDGSWTSYGCDGTTPTNSGSITETESLQYQTGSDAAGPFLTLTNVVTGNAVTFRRE